MMRLVLFEGLVVLLLKCAFGAVTLSGGPYCITSSDVVMYAEPGTTISMNCVFDANVLTWRISTPVTVTINHVDGEPLTRTVQGFTSEVNSFDSGVTNATLTFTATSDLDEMLFECTTAGGSPSSNCTLLVLTPPSAPTSLMCTDIMNDSLTLRWSEPTDNGGEEELQYNTTGTPGDINIVEGGNSVTLGSLTDGTTYYFTISSNNSVGFGAEATVNCTTEKNKPPPMFDSVMVCLDFIATDDNDPNTTLVVEALPCPLSSKAEEFTPEITNYTVNANGSSIFVEKDPGVCNFAATVNPGVYTIDVCASNNVETSKTSYNNGSLFYALWLRDVRVMDITNSSAAIHYTTADCVERDELLDIELVVAPSVTTATSQYYTSTSSSFTLTSLMQADTIMFTLQVVVNSTDVTVASTIGSFIVSSIEETTTTSSASVSSTGSTESTETTSTSETTSTEATSTPEATTSSNTLPIIGGVVGAIVAIVAIVIIILAVIACYIYYKNMKNKTSGSSNDPIPLHETKGPLPETGQALYQDPTTIERQQAPTGDMYALPDKPRRQPPPPDSSATEAATYQDPNTIERQQAPTGDTYAMPQKKTQSLKVDEAANKGSPAMYAELGFEDSSQPLVSPSGQPLIPKDTTQVLYAEVSEHRQ